MRRARLIKQCWIRFAVAGAVNTSVSQGVLLVLLPVIAATLVSQLLQSYCGYLTSGKEVLG